MSSRHYEVAIVGGRLSAVVTAALLAKRGVRGLLIDEGELASEDPHLLVDSVATDQKSQVIKLVHRELGLQDELRNRSSPVQPLLQVVWPDQRLDLFDDPRRLIEEMGRALGPHGEGVDVFLDRLTEAADLVGEYLASAGELPPSGYFSRRGARSLAKRFAPVMNPLADSELLADLDPMAVELFRAPLPYITYVEERDPDAGTVARFARPLALFLSGTRTLRNGRTLRGLLAGVAERRAFEVQNGHLEAAEPKGRQIQLRLANQSDTITTEAMIDASGGLSGLSVLPLQRRKKDVSETLQTARPRATLYALGIELDDAVVPPGIGQHLLLLNGRQDPSRFRPDEADRALWLTCRPGKEPGRTQLVVAHPVSATRAQSDTLESLEAMMKKRVERLIPFMSDGRPEIRPLIGRGAGRSVRPVLDHPLFEPDLDPETGLTGVACRTSLKNVFIAGPAVLPGLGIEGEYLAALQAADACESLLRGTKTRRGLAQR